MIIWRPIEKAPKEGRFLLLIPMGGGRFHMETARLEPAFRGESWVDDGNNLLSDSWPDPVAFAPVPNIPLELVE